MLGYPQYNSRVRKILPLSFLISLESSEDLTIGKASEEDIEAIVKLISEYQDVFSEGEHDVGFCDKTHG